VQDTLERVRLCKPTTQRILFTATLTIQQRDSDITGGTENVEQWAGYGSDRNKDMLRMWAVSFYLSRKCFHDVKFSRHDGL
jgi:hypothetical protein